MRPTSERARQAYFNIIGERIHGARFLDLFAGSGIFAFEAMSRGAASATSIDRDKRNAAGIAKHSAAFGVPVNALTGDVLAVLKRVKDPFDLVYADPPYDYEQYEQLIATIENLALATDAIVAVEHRRGSSPFDAAQGKLQVSRRAEYGEVWITFLTLAEAATGIADGAFD